MRKSGTSRSAAPRWAGLLIICAGFLSAACGGDPDDTTAAGSTTSQAATGGAGSSQGRLTQDDAYEMAVKGISGDPAVTELPRSTFDALSRLTCESLKEGIPVQRKVDVLAQQPTKSGIPMRRESAEKLIAAGVRAYCPEFASQLP